LDGHRGPTDGQTGNQGWEGSLGLDIFDRVTQALVTPTLVFSGLVGTQVGGYRLDPLASVVSLAPGQYSVVVWGYGSGEANGNAGCNGQVIGTCLGGTITPPTPNSGGGVIEFVGSGRFGAAGAYPNSVDLGPFNRYLAARFTLRTIGAGTWYGQPVRFGLGWCCGVGAG
jgi:hypothetical protein